MAPLPDGKWRLIVIPESPTKHIIILAVTVRGRGPYQMQTLKPSSFSCQILPTNHWNKKRHTDEWILRSREAAANTTEEFFVPVFFFGGGAVVEFYTPENGPWNLKNDDFDQNPWRICLGRKGIFSILTHTIHVWYTYIWLICMVNVGKYTIHGWYG